MQIEVKGRNIPVNDELRELVERKFRKVGNQVSDLAAHGGRVARGAQPRHPVSQVAEATLYLKGVTLARRGLVARDGPRAQPVLRRARAPGQAPPRQAPQRREARSPDKEPVQIQQGRIRRGCVALRHIAAGRRRLPRYPRAHGAPRPRPAHGRSQAVQAVREARRRASTTSSPSSSSRPTTSCARGWTVPREQARNGEKLDDLLPETFAIVREAGKRELGMRHFDVQLIGGMVLHGGSIAEMRPARARRSRRRSPVVLNALPGTGVHLVTVNDYLARRDAEWMSPIYHALGLNVGVLQNMQDYEDEARAPTRADVTYGTNSEFGFDYLRDNMAQSLEEKVQRGRPFAIVDEVDNILIDEARTPLIISGQPEAAADLYGKFAQARQDDGPRQEARGHGPAAEEGLRRRLRLRVRGEAQDRLGHRAGRREGREVPRHLAPLPRRERPARQPPAAGAEGRVALQARRRLRRHRRRGEDHRRVHRPHPRGPALVGGPAPGGRGEGGRARPGGEPDPRDDHAAELLPPLREARGHDRHGPHRGDRVHEDLQAAGRRDPDEPGHGPPGQERSGLQDEGRQVGRRQPRDHRHATTPASRCSSARSPSRSPSCCPRSCASAASSTPC